MTSNGLFYKLCLTQQDLRTYVCNEAIAMCVYVHDHNRVISHWPLATIVLWPVLLVPIQSNALIVGLTRGGGANSLQQAPKFWAKTAFSPTSRDYEKMGL